MGKRFMVPLLIVCSLLVSVAALMGISMLWQQETLAVRDMQGSPSALEPYQVTETEMIFHNLSFSHLHYRRKYKGTFPLKGQKKCLRKEKNGKWI